ncbi:MAG: hypothetical protein FJ308_11890 [Planctomycetes bacterium]|nr:hypothetical protein [Planctomycetota bacterium]
MQTRLALERCRFLAAGPLGMESYGPRTTCIHWNGYRWFKRGLLRSGGLAIRRPFLPPDSIPPSMASAFVLAAASMTAVSLRSPPFNPNLTTLRANPLQAGGRILLKPWACIMHALFRSNRLD